MFQGAFEDVIISITILIMLLICHTFSFRVNFLSEIQVVRVSLMHWWCVLFILPVLMAGALSPNVCCLNTTIVAGIQPVAGEQKRRLDYSTSVVDTGLL